MGKLYLGLMIKNKDDLDIRAYLGLVIKNKDDIRVVFLGCK